MSAKLVQPTAWNNRVRGRNRKPTIAIPVIMTAVITLDA